jgi:2-dehydropantoate 2-reductase
MRILVIGAGALGGYFGARLVDAGRDVTFMVRPGRAAQLARTGLQVTSPRGDFAVPAKTIAPEAICDPFDLVLLGVKSYSLDEAMDQFAPAVGPATSILPMLNGMCHIDRLSTKFGVSHVLGGMANISAGLDSEGRITQFIPNHDLVFGEGAGGSTPRIRAVEAAIGGAGFDARQRRCDAGYVGKIRSAWPWCRHHLPDARQHRRHPCGTRRARGDVRAVRRMLRCRHGLRLSARPAFIEFDHKLITTVGWPLKWSMLRDIERGSTTEGEHILGDMVARARKLGVATPILDLARTHMLRRTRSLVRTPRGRRQASSDHRELAVDHEQHAVKLMAAAQDQPGRRDHAVHALLARQTRILLNPVDWNLGRAAEQREHGAILQEIDGVVAPLTLGHHAAVKVEDSIELETIERHLVRHRTRNGDPRRCVTSAWIGILRNQTHGEPPVMSMT